MKAKLLVAIALLLPALLAIKLKVSVDRNEGPVCFYENMRNTDITQKKIRSISSK